MAKITLPYILQNHNNADGGQVQDDFNAILAQVNGNLDGENVGNGAISLPKLGSDVKVLEAIYSIALASDVAIPNTTETEVLSQALNLSAARYCLFLITGKYDGGSYDWYHDLYDGASMLDSWINYQGSTGSAGTANTYHSFAQLSAGSHTITLKINQDSGGDKSERTGTRMTIVQFAF